MLKWKLGEQNLSYVNTPVKLDSLNINAFTFYENRFNLNIIRNMVNVKAFIIRDIEVS